jgi:hypothetical protein
MSGVSSMLSRVQRLERSRAPAPSPFELEFGSLDAWEAECQTLIDEEILDSRDFPVVLMSVRRWHRDGVWGR